MALTSTRFSRDRSTATGIPHGGVGRSLCAAAAL